MAEQILAVALSSIDAPDGWNARSGAWHEDGADPTSDDGGYEGLKASMLAVGRNDEPVLLRPSHKFGMLILVDGFRRFRVAGELGWTTIRAVVETMSDFEARRRNLAAQAGRLKHKPADLAWGLWELKKLGPELSDRELGAIVGISGHYAGVLRRIMQDIDPKVTSAWRSTVVKVEIAGLQSIAALPKEKHWQMWEEVLRVQNHPAAKAKFTDALRLEKRARDLGHTLGTLERFGVVLIKNLTHAVPYLTKRDLTQEQMKKLDEIIQQGVQEGLSGKDK